MKYTQAIWRFQQLTRVVYISTRVIKHLIKMLIFYDNRIVRKKTQISKEIFYESQSRVIPPVRSIEAKCFLKGRIPHYAQNYIIKSLFFRRIWQKGYIVEGKRSVNFRLLSIRWSELIMKYYNHRYYRYLNITHFPTKLL